MKAELAKIKQENSEMHHREAFKIAAARWAESNDNPKNQKGGVTAALKAPEDAEEGSKDEAGEESKEGAKEEDQEKVPVVEEPEEKVADEQPTTDEAAAGVEAAAEPAE